MNPGKTQLEATADLDIPPRIWQAIIDGATEISRKLWRNGSVGLRVVTQTEIRELNNRFRNVNQTTDVLSFPTDNDPHHGDIALCWDVAATQAELNSNSVEAEALALICHGLLHLDGYNHETDEADAEMNRLTRELCKSAGVEVHTFGH